jgi:hypothetical protein
MDPVIVASARKHGISDKDMLHAYRNPIRVFQVEDLVMLIGGDESGRMLEVGVGCRRRHRVHHPRHARPRQVLEVTSMPRSIQDILDHADELAKGFEDYEPAERDQVPVEEYLLRRAALTRARSERDVVDAVTAARSVGISWGKIGGILGTSAQAAQQRYSAVVDQT